MKKTDFKKLKVGDRVTVTGVYGLTFGGSEGVIKTVDEEGDVLVHFDNWSSGHGPGQHRWRFWLDHAGDFTITVIPEAPKAEPKPKKRPHGPQEYRGNGKHEWQAVANGTERLRVPGGWLYRYFGNALTFVPVPEAVGYAV